MEVCTFLCGQRGAEFGFLRTYHGATAASGPLGQRQAGKTLLTRASMVVEGAGLTSRGHFSKIASTDLLIFLHGSLMLCSSFLDLGKTYFLLKNFFIESLHGKLCFVLF